ncbi:MAG: preprotein translocase subunit SecG [Burkholderiales bacterium]
MQTFILIIHVLTALGVIGLVLLQHGKGADMGAAFGSGSAGSLFGSSGSANFLSRTTGILAAVFFMTSLGLTVLSSHKGTTEGVMSTHQEELKAADEKPAAPAAPTGDSKAGEVPK